MNNKDKYGRKLKIFMEIGVLAIIVAAIVVFVLAYKDGHFDSVASLQAYVDSFGAFGPIVVILIRLMLVIAPIFPVPVMVVATAVMFGPLQAFIYIYIGNILGATVGYWLGAIYGPVFVKGLISEKVYDKYVAKIANMKNFNKFYAIAISTPLFPDDILCYFCGLGKQTFKTFILTNIVLKPIVIALYCFVFIKFIPA